MIIQVFIKARYIHNLYSKVGCEGVENRSTTPGKKHTKRRKGNKLFVGKTTTILFKLVEQQEITYYMEPPVTHSRFRQRRPAG